MSEWRAPFSIATSAEGSPSLRTPVGSGSTTIVNLWKWLKDTRHMATYWSSVAGPGPALDVVCKAEACTEYNVREGRGEVPHSGPQVVSPLPRGRGGAPNFLPSSASSRCVSACVYPDPRRAPERSETQTRSACVHLDPRIAPERSETQTKPRRP